MQRKRCLGRGVTADKARDCTVTPVARPKADADWWHPGVAFAMLACAARLKGGDTPLRQLRRALDTSPHAGEGAGLAERPLPVRCNAHTRSAHML